MIEVVTKFPQNLMLLKQFFCVNINFWGDIAYSPPHRFEFRTVRVYSGLWFYSLVNPINRSYKDIVVYSVGKNDQRVIYFFELVGRKAKGNAIGPEAPTER